MLQFIPKINIYKKKKKNWRFYQYNRHDYAPILASNMAFDKKITNTAKSFSRVMRYFRQQFSQETTIAR